MYVPPRGRRYCSYRLYCNVELAAGRRTRSETQILTQNIRFGRRVVESTTQYTVARPFNKNRNGDMMSYFDSHYKGEDSWFHSHCWLHLHYVAQETQLVPQKEVHTLSFNTGDGGAIKKTQVQDGSHAVVLHQCVVFHNVAPTSPSNDLHLTLRL